MVKNVYYKKIINKFYNYNNYKTKIYQKTIFICVINK